MTNIILLNDNDYNWTCNHSYEEMSSLSKEELSRIIVLFNDEVWKSCSMAGFSNYQVSNYGRVKRLKEIQIKSTGVNDTLYTSIIPEKILTGHLAEDSYIYVSLKNDKNKRIDVPAHRLVAFIFCQTARPDNIDYKTKNKKVVDHINRIKNDNRAINLRWTSYSENGKNISKKDYTNRYDYRNPLTDENAKETDLITDVIPNVSPRWFTKVNFKGEEWRTVQEYEEYRVSVSNYGRILKPIYHSENTYIAFYYERKRYFHVTLPQRSFEKTQKLFRVHQLVAQEFLNYAIGSVDENGKRYVIDHIDTDKHNNTVNNLRICTQKENSHNETTLKRYAKKTYYSALSYRVNAYEYPSGDFVNQFENYVAASMFFNISTNVVSNVCNGKAPISYSKKYNKYYIFRNCELSYIDDKTNLWESSIFNIYDLYNDTDKLFYRRKERIYNVYEYPTGNFLKRYDSTDEISKECKLSLYSIWSTINGKTALSFSKDFKKYYVIRRIDFNNMNNYKNLFDSDLLNISGQNITKEFLENSYNHNLEKYINLYAYPSGKFIKQFNYIKDVLNYFNGRIKNYTAYTCLSDDKTIIKDCVFKSYFVLRYVDDKDVILPINDFNRNELNIMINQKQNSTVIYTYNNIYDIRDMHPDEFDIDLIFYHLQTDKKAYGFDWSYTRKHNKTINNDVMKLSSKRKIISVNKYSLEGKYICSFDDLYDICPDEIKLDNIRNCINGKIMSAYGFIWKDSNDYPIGKDLELQKPVKMQFLYFSAYDENDNLIESFKSTKVAAEKYGIVVRKIYRMLNKEVYIDYDGTKIKFKKDEYNGLI